MSSLLNSSCQPKMKDCWLRQRILPSSAARAESTRRADVLVFSKGSGPLGIRPDTLAAAMRSRRRIEGDHRRNSPMHSSKCIAVAYSYRIYANASPAGVLVVA
jgi:hypothetical protein